MIFYKRFPHHSVKWWKRVFFHIVDTAIANAQILYNACAEVKLTQLEFCRAAAEGVGGWIRHSKGSLPREAFPGVHTQW